MRGAPVQAVALCRLLLCVGGLRPPPVRVLRGMCLLQWLGTLCMVCLLRVTGLLLCVLGLHLYEVLPLWVLRLYLHQVLPLCVLGLPLHQVLLQSLQMSPLRRAVLVLAQCLLPDTVC